MMGNERFVVRQAQDFSITLATGRLSTQAHPRCYLAELRQRHPHGASDPGTARRAAPVPSPRAVAWLLRKADVSPRPQHPEEQACVAALGASCPPLQEARRVAAAFVQMLASHDVTAPDACSPRPNARRSGPLRRACAGITTRCSPRSSSAGVTARSGATCTASN